MTPLEEEMLDLLRRAQAAFFDAGTRKALLPVMLEIAAFRRRLTSERAL